MLSAETQGGNAGRRFKPRPFRLDQGKPMSILSCACLEAALMVGQNDEVRKSQRPSDVTNERVAANVLDLRSPRIAAFFGWIFDRSLRSSFNAVRLDRSGAKAPSAASRVIVYTNHPSWWDAVVYSYVGRHIFSRPTFSPIDAKMLKRYPFMARIGAFGVEQNSLSGARRFRAVCNTILGQDDTLLIVACQGRFADVRERPLRIESGIAHLADLATDTIFVPLAIEYTFWTEKRPELLLRFGDPITGDILAALPVKGRLARLETTLEATMTALAVTSSTREPAAFDKLVTGSGRINLFYDSWRQIKAFLTGRIYKPRHGDKA
jgi:1-acyl-sn-glycerol-3-phosphate acyltransferase